MKTSSFTTLLAACGITLAGPLAAQDGTPKPLPPLDNAPPSAEHLPRGRKNPAHHARTAIRTARDTPSPAAIVVTVTVRTGADPSQK